MVKFCSNCGEKLDSSVKFCPNCGKEVFQNTDSQIETYADESTQKNILKKIFTTKGRLNRLRYFKYHFSLFLMFAILEFVIFFSLGFFHPVNEILTVILGLIAISIGIFNIVAQIMLAIRRLHDLNYSGWYYLLWLIFIMIASTTYKVADKTDNIYFLICSLIFDLLCLAFSLCMLFKKGTVGTNKYGADPLFTR